MKKDANLFLQYFAIKHLSDLIGRKLLIYVNFLQYDKEYHKNEICFQIQQYHFSNEKLDFIVPTVGLEGNSDIRNIVLSFFPNKKGKEVEYSISFQSDYAEEGADKGNYISLTGRKGSRHLKVKLV